MLRSTSGSLVSEQRPGARALVGSSAVALNSSQVSSAASEGHAEIPTFAFARSAPSKASAAISSETVNPMPAIVPPPATAAQPTGGRSRPRLSRASSHGAPTMPDRLADDVPGEDARASSAR